MQHGRTWRYLGMREEFSPVSKCTWSHSCYVHILWRGHQICLLHAVHVYRSKGYYASCVISGILVQSHVYDILIPDSFMYACYTSCIILCHFNTWQFHVYLSCYGVCIWHFNTWQFHLYLLSQLPADMHDLYTVIWQCTGEVLAIGKRYCSVLLAQASGSPHNFLHLH